MADSSDRPLALPIRAAVARDRPTFAAIFQKDPQVLLAHPEANVKKLDDLKPLTLFVSKEGVASYFQWLKSEYGFDEAKVKPYTFNPQPFLADKKSAMPALANVLLAAEGNALRVAATRPARGASAAEVDRLIGLGVVVIGGLAAAKIFSSGAGDTPGNPKSAGSSAAISSA